MGCIRLILACLLPLLCATQLAAQVHVDGLHFGLSGNVSMGYNGDEASPGGSDHSLSFGGDGTLSGYYHHPNFATFTVQPYYNRSQNNSTSSSIEDSSGYTGSVLMFGGTRAPLVVSFGQTFDSTGLFGIPNTAGLTTKDSNRMFGVGWGFAPVGLPSISLGYSAGSSTSSVYGSPGQSEGTSRNFTASSAYRFAGFNMRGGYTHQTTDSTSTDILQSGSVVNNNTNNTYQFSISHAIPLHGMAGGTYSHSDYNSDDISGSTHGTINNASANVGINLWRLPISADAEYTDNLYGSIEELSLGNGVVLPLNTTSPESRSLLVNVSTSYRVLRGLFVTGFVSRQEQQIAGATYGLTLFGANASYNFDRRFRGLSVTLGMRDAASQEGNTGGGLIASANYNATIVGWILNANFVYDQNVQTLLATYTTSDMNYTAQARRKLRDGITVSVGGGGGRSGFEQGAGNGSHSEGVNAGLSWRRYSATANYSQSAGTSVLTSAGLVAVPLPVVSPADLIVFDGKSYGASIGMSPMRYLNISAGYSKANSNTVSPNLNSANQTELYNAVLTYQFRKLYFNAGATRFWQVVGNSGTPPSVITSYYFGVTRWFKVF